MSKHPSDRVDQLRALREAKYARKNAAPQTGASAPAREKPVAPVKPAPEIATAEDAAPAPKKSAAKKKASKKKAATPKS